MKAVRYTVNTSLILGLGIAISAPASADLTFDPRGRLHLDAAFHDTDNLEDEAFQDGFLVRRARLGGSGSLIGNWGYQLEFDFSGGSISYNDLKVTYDTDAGTWQFGQFKVPQGMEQLTSSNRMTFIERASSQVFTDSRRIGLGYGQSGDNYHFSVMGYSHSIEGDPDGDAPLGMAGRVTFNPIRGDQTIHLGASLSHEAFSSNAREGSVRFRDRPESRPTEGTRLIDTSSLDARSTTKAGLEFGFLSGPFHASAEYLQAEVDRDSGSDLTFNGWHVQAGYVLTGETRGYRPTGFRTIDPQRPSGAWEIAARYSSVDLGDADILGGEQNNFTLGLNYYVSSNLRFMANYVMVDVKDSDAVDSLSNGAFRDDSPNIFLARMQYNF
ncbi:MULTISPECIES: OprO/OprP family phosphate-selective porin [unclassified Thioalkalivibrio]|uniref:OprO/OprP family phosphate-selective porin n=1 Tax=unclassified Thioalkalivibrio TaxID=2621013 RepID=UPI0003631026|nr:MULTISPECIES: OprO/OprP family phosphate-selective porin [unclassified Thioalkalivibrio]